ncbi:MAG: VOC family protein [Acidimicrobiia bacterium]|nr:VOC family protein [Acidimicrobiia bacterium]
MDLDHVALATADVTDALDFFVGRLGGTILFGGQGPGFRPMTLRIGDAHEGMNVELLEPWDTHRSDFLARFLERDGEGPHHLTFKVPDLRATLERVGDAGLHPVNVDLSNPAWMEAFLHPREVQGTVVQLAQAADIFGDRAELLAHVADHGPRGNPAWWPPAPPAGPRASMRRVVIGTPSLPETRSLYTGLLEGEEIESGEGWVELAWPGGARVRLESRGGAPGVDRLEYRQPGSRREDLIAGTRLVAVVD